MRKDLAQGNDFPDYLLSKLSTKHQLCITLECGASGCFPTHTEVPPGHSFASLFSKATISGYRKEPKPLTLIMPHACSQVLSCERQDSCPVWTLVCDLGVTS